MYVAGDTLARREIVEGKTKCVGLWCMLCHVCLCLSYDMVYLGDGSGIAVMPSVPILVVCITNLTK